MRVEPATKASLAAICDLIRASIEALCTADHGNQEHHLDTWLAERSADRLEPVLFGSDSQAFVCIDGDRLTGVSHVRRDGELTLCYVDPRDVGRGVGRAVLDAAEDQALRWGLGEVYLTSTATARAFYLANGYEASGAAVPCMGMPGYPLRKRLGTEPAQGRASGNCRDPGTCR